MGVVGEVIYSQLLLNLTDGVRVLRNGKRDEHRLIKENTTALFIISGFNHSILMLFLSFHNLLGVDRNRSGIKSGEQLNPVGSTQSHPYFYFCSCK